MKPRRIFSAARLSFPLATALLALFSAQSAHALAYNWTGATNGTWNTPTNWSGGVVPLTGDTLTILGPANVAGALNINFNANNPASTITVTNTAATTLTNTTSGANKTLTLSGSGTTLTTGSGAVTIGSATANQAVNVALGASQTWSVGTGGLTVNNIISGSGFGITKSGTGTLTLGSASNSFNGGIIVSAGNLTSAANGSLANNSITFSNNAIFTTAAPDATTGGMTLNNSGFVKLVNNNSSFTVGGKVTGGGGLEIEKGGSGSITVNLNATDNDFTGGINFLHRQQNQSATVTVNSFADTAVAGTGNIILGATGGTVTGVSISHNFNYGSGATTGLTLANRRIALGNTTQVVQAINNNSGQALTISSDLLVSGSNGKILTLGGTGAGLSTFSGIISNATTPITGTTLVAGGASSGLVTAIGNTSFMLASVQGIAVGASISATGIPASTTVTAVNPVTNIVTISNALTAALGLGSSVTVTGVTNSVQVVKAGGGTWLLSGPNTYTGGTIVTAGTLSFRNGSLGTTGNITINGGTLQWDGTNTQDISSRLRMVNATTATLNTNGNTVTLATAFGGSTSGALTKSGAGTLILSGANSYTGLASVSEGTLRAGSNTAFGTTAGGVSVTSGAAVDLNGRAIGAEAFTLNGTGISSAGALINSSGTTASVGGAVTLGSATSIVPGSGNITLSSTLGMSTFALTKDGASQLTLGGIVSGTKTVATTALTVSSGLLTMGITTAANNNTFSGNIAVDGASSVFAMAGAAFTTSAPYGRAGNLYKQLLLTNGGTFSLTGGTFNNQVPDATNTAEGIIFNIGTGDGILDIAAGATLIIDDGTGTGTASAASQLQGSGNLTKTGLGIFQFDDSTAYAGTITATAGLLQPASANAFGASSAGTTIQSGAALNFAAAIVMTNAEPLNLAGTGLTSAPVGALTAAVGPSTWIGPITLDSDATIGGGAGTLTVSSTIDIGANTLTLSHSAANQLTNGIISGTGNVIVSGTSTGVVGMSAASTYTGGTSLNSGFVAAGFSSTGSAGSPADGPFGAGSAPLILNGAALRSGTGAPFTVGNTITLAADTLFNTNGSEKTLTFTGPVTLTGATRTLTSNVGNTVAGTSVIFNGAIGDGASSFGLIKAGTGNLTLGAANTYDGGTTVNEGALVLSGSLQTATDLSISPTTAGGATFSLASGTANPLANVSALTLGSATGPSLVGLELGVNTAASDSITTPNAATTTGIVNIGILPLAGFGVASSYDLISAPSGLDGATYVLTSVPGGYTYSLTTTATLVSVNVTPAAAAGDLYWRGNINSSWSALSGSNTNWYTDAAGSINAPANPIAGDTVNFSTINTIGPVISTTLDNNFTVNDLVFSSSPNGVTAVNVAGGLTPAALPGVLSIAPSSSADGINVASDAGAVTISAPLLLGAAQTWTVDGTGANGSSLAVSGGSTGTANLEKTGAGTLTLAGAHMYVGTTTVTGGVLQAGGTTGFNQTSAHTLGAAATLRLNGFSNTIASLNGAVGAIVENGAASGNIVLSSGGDNTSTTFAGTVQNGAAATLGLTKLGTGSLTLSGANTYTGGTIVSAGKLNLTDTNTFGAGGINVGNAAGNSVLNLSGSANVTLTGSTTVGTANGASGAVNISGATFASTAAGGELDLNVGSATGGYGYLGISGGTVGTNRLQFGGQGTGATTGTGVGVISSGTTTVREFLLIGRNTGALGSLTITGGTLNHLSSVGGAASQNIALAWGGGTGVLNMQGGTLNSAGKNLSVREGNTGTSTGIVNLNDDTLTVNAITNNLGTAYLNFDGGTLQAGAATQTLVPSTLTGTYINASGGTINNGGFAAITVAGNLLAPVGSGVTGIAVTNGGSGYIGAPFVTITDSGTGVSATAIANMVDDLSGNGTFKIDSFTVTNPGVNFTGSQTVTLTGGGGSGAVVGAVTTGALTSGGMTFTGSGTTILTGDGSTYTGGTTVSGGTLTLGINGGLPTNGNLTIDSSGTFNAATFTNSAGTVSLQSGTITGSTGVITSNANYDLRSGSVSFTGAGGLGGAVNVIKSTAGTVTLTNNGLGSFANAVNITGGTLAFSSPTQLGNASVTNTLSVDGGTLSYTAAGPNDLNRPIAIGASDATVNVAGFAGVLTVNSPHTLASTGGNLVKTGPGTLLIPGDTTLNTGLAGVAVNEGTLQAGFGTGGVAAISVGATGNLDQRNGARQALTLGNAAGALTLAGGASLGFELSDAPGNDSIAVGASGTAVTSGVVTLNFYGTVTAGTYNLLSAPSGLAAADYALGVAPIGFNYTINETDSLVSVTVIASVPSYWRGGQNLSWNTLGSGPANWTTDSAGTVDATSIPVFTDTVTFGAAGAPTGSVITTLDALFTVDSLLFRDTPGSANVTISAGAGGALTLTPASTSGGIRVLDGGGNATISAPLTIGAAQTWDVDPTGSLTISGDTVFNGPVNKTNTGAVTLSGTNSGAGAITLTGGTLNINSATALGAGTFTIGAGTTINASVPTALTPNNVQNWNGDFTFSGTNNLDLGTGAVTLGSSLVLTTSASSLTVGGIIGDGGNNRGITKAGAGTMILNGANTYTGPTAITGGILRITNNTALGTVAGGVTQTGSSALELDGTGGAITVGAEALTINGGGVSLPTPNLGALRNIAGDNTYGGTITMGSQSRINSDSGTLTLSNPTSVSATNLNLVVGGAGNLTISGAIATGTGGVSKGDAGILTLGGNNTYTGNTTIGAGTLNITGSWTGNTTSTTLALGGTAGNTVTNVSGDITAFGFTGGAVNGAVAVYNQTAGLASFAGNTATAVYVANNQGSYGYLNITGGTFKSARRFGIAQSLNVAIQSTGITYVGGTGILDLTNSEWALNYSHGHVTVAGNGLIDRTGATNPYGIIMNSTVSGGVYGVLNVAGGAFLATTQPIQFGNSTTAANGNNNTAIINLAAGTLQVGTAMTTNLPSAGANKGYINFAGGILKTSAAVTNLIPTAPSGITLTSNLFGVIDNSALAGAPSFVGGLTFDSNGFDSSLGTVLGAATGDGVAQSSLTVTPGTGYIGAPEVIFTGGTLTANGTPAAGYALISGGAVTGIVITSPGTYSVAPSVSLVGGGGTGAGVTVGTLVANTSGGLTKINPGTLTLTGANTYAGATLVSGGTLQLNGTAATAPTTSAVTVSTGGRLGFTTAAASTLDLKTKAVTLSGGTLNFDIGVSGTNDMIEVQDFTLTANSAFTFNSLGGLSEGGSYTLLTSTNPISNSGPYTITGQTVGRVILTPTINPNSITVGSTLDEGEWGVDSGGNWSVAGNWTGYLPSTAGDAALFGAAITAPTTVAVDTPQSVGFMRFNNANAYTIGANGSDFLTLNNGANSAVLAVTSGSHTIAENVLLASNMLTLPAANATLTISGVISGASRSLQVNGAGTVVLSGANTYTGTTVVSLGKLNVTGNTTGTGNVTVGNTVGNAVLNVPTGGSLIGTASGLNPTITLGTGGTGSSGALNITGGTVNLQGTETTDGSSFASSNGGYAAFFMSGGSFTQQRFMFGGTGTTTGAGGVGVGLQTGGTVNSTGWMIFGRAGASIGSYTITGGTLNHAGAAQDIAIGLQGTGRGELNVAGGLIDNTGRRVDFSGGATGSFSWTGTGLLNLNAGTLLTNAVFYSSGTAYANFNGGTLKAAATNTSFMNAITTGGAYVNGAFGAFNGGAVIDSNGFDVTVGAPLIAPTGDGVATIPVTSGGSGYIGAPAVSITDGGSGFGASAIANMVDDLSGNGTLKIDSITITNPGNNYTAPAVALIGGGNGVVAATLGSLTTAANTSGGLTKDGLGNLTLSAVNSYTGATAINAGTLTINEGSIANSSNIVNNAALAYALTTNARSYANAITGSGTLTKSGTNSLTLSGNNNYSGGTSITGGTLQIGANGTSGTLGSGAVANAGTLVFDRTDAYTLAAGNVVTGAGAVTLANIGAVAAAADGQFNTTGALNFGAANGSSIVSSLDLTNGSSTFDSLLARTNSTSANTIAIGATKTLTIIDGLTVGYVATAGTPTDTLLTASGAGAMVVNGTAISIGQDSGTPANPVWVNNGVLDVSDLANFTTNVTNINLGVGTNGAGEGDLLLSNTANTVVATTITVGNTGGNNGSGTNSITLGTGSNAIQADLIEIGKGKSSGPGVVTFASQAPSSPGTVTIANKAGSGAANITVANLNGVGTGAGAVGTLDLRGHVATVNAGTLLISQANHNNAVNAAGTNGTVRFDDGTFTVATLNMAPKTGLSTGTATATLSVGGGDFTVNTAFTLGSQATAGASVATLNLTGGSFTSNPAITRGAGTTTATINLDGGTLDMTNDAIGSGTNPITLNAKQGTLQNLGEFNGGGTLTKSTAGILTLTGTNGYTGTTAVTEGTLALVGGNHASPITVSSGAALDFTLGSPTTSSSTFNLSAGTIKITGTPTLPSYTLISSSTGITGTPVLHTPIAGYVLKKVGNTLVLENPYEAWAAANNATGGKTGDPDGDLIDNLTEYAFGTDPQSGVQGPIAYSGGVVTAVGNPVVEEDAGVWYAVFGRRTDYVAAGLVYTVEFGAGLNQWTASVTVPTPVATDGVIDAVRVPFPNFVPTLSGPKKPTFFRVDISETP